MRTLAGGRSWAPAQNVAQAQRLLETEMAVAISPAKVTAVRVANVTLRPNSAYQQSFPAVCA